MKMIQIVSTGNFQIRIIGRAVFEYCDHYIVKFDYNECKSDSQTTLCCKDISLQNVEKCDFSGFSIKRMRQYLKKSGDTVKGKLYYLNMEDVPVGCLWIGFKGTNEAQYRVREVEAFGFDFAVRSDMRGMGIVGKMICQALEDLHAKGIDELYCGVRTNNDSAQRAYLKIGGKIVGHKRFFRIVGICIPYPII